MFIIDTLGYETDTYFIHSLSGEALSELQGELGTEELGFFKSLKKLFKKVWRGVKKIVKKPVKIIRKAWKGIKKGATKLWKLVRRNKRTLLTAGLVAASTALPILKPIAYPLAMKQATNIVGRYIYGKPKVQYEEIPQVQYQYETSQIQPAPITPIDATMPQPQAQAPYAYQYLQQPYQYAYQGYEKPSLGKALLPLGLFVAGLFLFNK